MDAVFALSIVVFLPTLVALLLALFPRGSDELIRIVTLVTTAITLILCLWLMVAPFDVTQAEMQQTFN